MRIDCHTHTSLHSPCSVLHPTQLCELALQRGLDALAITEHFYQWSSDAIEELRKAYPTLTIYSGVEYKVQEGYDIVCLLGEHHVRLERTPTLAELEDSVAAFRGEVFLFVAHPFRYQDELTPGLKRILRVVDGIEMNSINILRAREKKTPTGYFPDNYGCYERVLAQYPLVAVYNSDAHYPLAPGAIAMDVDCASVPESEKELAHVLRRACITEYQNTALLEEFFQWYARKKKR